MTSNSPLCSHIKTLLYIHTQLIQFKHHKMALKKTLLISFQILLPNCVKTKKHKAITHKQISIQRLSLSDVSFPDSPISLNDLSNSLVGSNLHIFTLKELKTMTRNFSKSEFLGEGGFGPVYKGHIRENLRSGLEPQTVAVKVLDLHGSQGHKEWLVSYFLYFLNLNFVLN